VRNYQFKRTFRVKQAIGFNDSTVQSTSSLSIEAIFIRFWCAPHAFHGFMRRSSQQATKNDGLSHNGPHSASRCPASRLASTYITKSASPSREYSLGNYSQSQHKSYART